LRCKQDISSYSEGELRNTTWYTCCGDLFGALQEIKNKSGKELTIDDAPLLNTHAVAGYLDKAAWCCRVKEKESEPELLAH